MVSHEFLRGKTFEVGLSAGGFSLCSCAWNNTLATKGVIWKLLASPLFIHCRVLDILSSLFYQSSSWKSAQRSSTMAGFTIFLDPLVFVSIKFNFCNPVYTLYEVILRNFSGNSANLLPPFCGYLNSRDTFVGCVYVEVPWYSMSNKLWSKVRASLWFSCSALKSML